MKRGFKDKIDKLIGEERGTIYKTGPVEVTVALAYPNTYHLGMANLGLHQIYSVINKRDDAVCERVFFPDEEDIDEFASSRTSLFTLETRRPLKEFDVLAFSVSFEQDYINILTMLGLAGISADKRERSGADPLLVLGGICSFFNPEPLADFFDVVIVGEGEEVIGEFIDLYKLHRPEDRRSFLRAACRIPGIYVPEFYEVSYHENGTIKERKSLEPAASDRIQKRSVKDISAVPAHSVIFTPNTEFSNMFLAEITRGCGRHCRFCMAGYIYLPPRNLSVQAAQERVKRADELCGKTGLVGAAISDYPAIEELCAATEGALSVSSLRADSVGEALIQRLAKSGHKTISIAPEAGSERLRKVINKAITEDHIIRAAGLVFGSGIPNLKLYFIIGLPTEEQADLEAIVMVTEKIREIQLKHARTAGRIGRITLSVNSFVPKPFTPFQWEPMEPVQNLNKKIRFLEKAVRKIGNTNIIHDLPKWEYNQALLSRGDRRIGGLIRAAHDKKGDWKGAARELGIDTDFYVTRRREFGEVLPWDFIDIGVRKDYLRTEYQRGLEGKYTPPCRVGSCKTCGVCE